MTAPAKLLYFGFAFPPGISGLFPDAQPAGHLMETNLVNALRPWFEIKSAGISWIEVEKITPDNTSPGLPHALNLLDKPPELLHRWRSLARLKRQYQRWTRSGWIPDAILMYNFSPVYNGFIRWLKREPCAPCLVLYLADSMNLQQAFPWTRRVRHALKPLTWPDSEMVSLVDACIGVSASTEKFFADRRLPWLWLPNGCNSGRALQPSTEHPGNGPIQFGYIGSLGAHAGAQDLLRVFLAREGTERLHICGFGMPKARVAALCRHNERLQFHEPRTPDACLRLSQTWDVLVNPRPIWPGNENNFPSKVFEYALSGRAILTSPISGVDQVLGEEAFYFDPADFDANMRAALDKVAGIPRAELRRRGACLQKRLIENYAWEKQGRRAAEFIYRQLPGSREAQEVTQPASETLSK